MKLYNKILAGAAFIALGAYVTSCSDDDNKWNPGSGNYLAPDAYFEIQDTNEVEIGEEDSVYVFNIYRESLNAPAVVELTWTGDTQLFDLPSTAVFGDEDVISEITVGIDPSKMEAAKPYSITVTIGGTENTQVTQNSIEIVLMYVPFSPWAPFGEDEALGRDGVGYYKFSLYYSGTEMCFVESRYSLLDENQIQYRFSWPYDYDDNDDPVTDEEGNIIWEVFLTAYSEDGGESIIANRSIIGYNSNYGDVWVGDEYGYFTDVEEPEGYFDDVTGTFYLDLVYFVNEGYFGYGYETCTLNGYLDTNEYSVGLSDYGVFTVGEVNYQIVNVSWNENVKMVSYAFIDASEIMDGTEVSQELVDSVAHLIEVDSLTTALVEPTLLKTPGNVQVSFDTKGTYAMVAIGYAQTNGGAVEVKTNSYLTFDYVTPDPNEGWTSLGYVPYTDGYLTAYPYLAVDEEGNPYTWDVEMQESDDEPGYYRLVNPYGEPCPMNEPGEYDPDELAYLYINATDPDAVYIEYSESYTDWGDGYFLFLSKADYYMNYSSTPMTLEEVIEEGLCGTIENKIITMPAVSLLYYDDEGGYSANFIWDYEASLETGYVEYLENEDGEIIAPFKVDFSNPKSTPSADATAKSVKASIKAKMQAAQLKAATTKFGSPSVKSIKRNVSKAKGKAKVMEAKRRTSLWPRDFKPRQSR